MALTNAQMLFGTPPSAPDTGYSIPRSLRFVSDDTTYLRRDFTPGDRMRWTLSMWVKRSHISISNYTNVLFSAWTANTNYQTIRFKNNGFDLYNRPTSGTHRNLLSTHEFLDPCAWQHCVFVWDTYQSDASARARIYVNGVEITAFDTATYPAQYERGVVNTACEHNIGAYSNGSYYFDGWIADVRFVDGLGLQADDFGEFSASNGGIWTPKTFAITSPQITSTDWSAQGTFTNMRSGTGDPQDLFDGDLTSYVEQTAQNTTWTWTGIDIPVSSSLRINSLLEGSPDPIVINDTIEVRPSATGWTTVPLRENGYTSLTKISCPRGGSGVAHSMRAIEIDGEILIDNQPIPTTITNYNDGTEWSSSSVLQRNGSWTSANAASCFDGDLTSTVSWNANGDSANFKPGWTGITSLRVYFTEVGDGSAAFSINGTDYKSSAAAVGDNAWWTAPTTVTTIDSTNGIYWNRIDNNDEFKIGAFEVNGYLLIDNAGDNSFHCDFNSVARNSDLGIDKAERGKIANCTGGLPIYVTTDDWGLVKGSGERDDFKPDGTTSVESTLVLAWPGDVVNGDRSNAINSSSSTKTINAAANAGVSTVQSKFYGTSALLVSGVATPGDAFYVTDHADLAFGTGDYTVEFWFRPTALFNNFVMYDSRANSGSWWVSSSGFSIVGNGNGQVSTYTGGAYVCQSPNGVIQERNWAHIAIVRDSGTQRLYVNGILEASASNTSNHTDEKAVIGSGTNHATDGEGSKGYYQDFRLYKGGVKYSGSKFLTPHRRDFDPVNLVATATGTGWGGAKTVTATNGATTTTSNTKFYGTSKELDGSDDYINTIASEDWDFPGEFTIELWFRPEATTGIRPLIAVRDVDSGWCFGYWPGQSGKFAFYTAEGTSPGGSGTEITWTPPSLFTNTWVHVAVTRNSSNSITIWVNGDNKTSSTVTGTLTGEYDDPVQIGNTWPSGMTQYDGQFSDIRIYKGVCKYVADFTVPDGSTSVASATGGLPIRNTSGTNGETALGGFRADVIPGTSTDVTPYLVLAIPGNTYEDVSEEIRGSIASKQDSSLDSPTSADGSGDGGNGGEVTANYCTWNYLDKDSVTNSTQGNLFAYGNNNGWSKIKGSVFVNTGKWYFEGNVTVGAFGDAIGNSYTGLGVVKSTNIQAANNPKDLTEGNWFSDNGWTRFGSGTYTQQSDEKWITGDVIGVAIDCSSQKVTFYRNGSQVATASSLWTAGDYVGPAETTYYNDYGAIHMNFGQRAFKHPVADHKCLCSSSLALSTQQNDQTIKNGKNHFDMRTYTGLGTGNTKTIGGLLFDPAFIWGKARSYGDEHGLCDKVRGASKLLVLDDTDAEDSTAGSYVTGFGTKSYTLGNGVQFNGSSTTYVNWLWNATSATAPTGTTSVYTDDTAGFSITAYTGDGTSPRTIPHSLGAKPNFVVIKNRDNNAGSWIAKHSSMASGKVAFLDNNNQEGDSGYGEIDDLSSTSTVSVTDTGNDAANVNKNTEKYIMYAWKSVAGYSAFGKYIGNEDTGASGPFVYTGFAVEYVMLKRIDAANDWMIYDKARDPYNEAKHLLKASGSGGDTTVSGADRLDFLSNGFKIKEDNAGMNAQDGEYIYIAFASNPFSLARAR